MSLAGIFTAIIIAMSVVPFLGYIPLGFMNATIIHVPVIIGAIILGPKYGAYLGLVFGVTSLVKATIAPGVTSFVFSPFVTIGGYSGNMWSAVIAIVPRVCIGIVAYFVYKLIMKAAHGIKGSQTVALWVAGIAGAMTNTLLVMNGIYIFFCKNTDKICIFTNKGQMHLLKVLDLPYGKFRDKGTPIDNLSNYNSSEENFVYITNLAAISHSQVLFGTKSAMLKVVDGSEFDVAKRTTAATKLNEGDELIFVQALALEETLVMQSEKDFFLRIDISSIPEKKKGAVGVRGMKLGAGDALAAIYLLNAEDVVNIEVKGKEVALNRLRTAGRDTKGNKR